MDLTYSDDQRLLKDSADRFVENYKPGRDGTWKEFADLGWLAMPIAEADGGLGGGAVENGILMEAFGRGLVSEPYLATVILGAGLVGACGNDQQRKAILPSVAAGNMRLAFAHSERAARNELSQIETTAKPANNGWQLNGHKIAVLDAESANTLIVSARVGDTAALFLVSRGTNGVTLIDYPRLGGGQASSVAFAGAMLPADARLGNSDAMPAIDATIDRAIAAICAEAVGIMDTLLARSLEYTKMRKQFGKALAANQVIRHRLVDMSVQCDEARSMAMRAALKANDRVVERSRAASAAKARIGKAARFVAEQAVQVHGAMGVTEELDVGAYFKRLLAFEMLFGSTASHLRRHAELSGRTRTD